MWYNVGMEIFDLILFVCGALCGYLIFFSTNTLKNGRWRLKEKTEDEREKEAMAEVLKKAKEDAAKDPEIRKFDRLNKHLGSDEFRMSRYHADHGDDTHQLIVGKTYYENANFKCETTNEMLKEKGIMYLKLSADQGNEQAKYIIKKIERTDETKHESSKSFIDDMSKLPDEDPDEDSKMCFRI